jgi:hypothetical protein
MEPNAARELAGWIFAAAEAAEMDDLVWHGLVRAGLDEVDAARFMLLLRDERRLKRGPWEQV